MMRTLVSNVLMLSLALMLASCATPPEPADQDKEVMSAIEEAETEGGDETFEENEEEVAEESEAAPDEAASEPEEGGELAEGEEPADEGFDEAAEGEEFADENFEDGEQQSAAQETPEEVPPEELPPLEEPLVEEPPVVAAPITPPIEEPGVAPQAVEVTNIQFRANQNGGTVVIETNGPATYQTRNNTGTNQFVIEIPNAILPDRLKRPFIMKDFEAAFAAINAYQNPGSTTVRIVVQQKSSGEPMVQQEGNSLLVIPSNMAVAQETPQPEPAAPAEEDWSSSYNTAEAARDEKVLGARNLDEFLTENNKFYGRPISIQTRDADIRDVIHLIAEESGVNLVLSEEVEGKVTLKLRNVPWDQALVIIMRAKKLGYIRQGNVLRISSLESLQAETATAKQILENQKTLAPLKMKVMPISYAKVEDIVKQIEPFLTPNRGKAVFDVRTSALIVTDVDERLEKITRLVKELDIPPAQVLIEGKVVEASEGFRRDIGLNWTAGGSPVIVSETGGANGVPLQLEANLRSTPFPPTTQGLASLGLDFGTLDFLGDLSATLSLAETENLVKIVSSPRVTTMNKEKAEIIQSGEIVTIASVAQQGGVVTRNVQRTPIVLSLIVTPQITASGSVIMEVDVTRQFAGPIEDQETLARATQTRNAKTKILVENGQTAVIGGIYQNDDTMTEAGIPGLKDIPLIGWLFKFRGRQRTKNELLIFLTPRILNLEGLKGDEETEAPPEGTTGAARASGSGELTA